MPSAKDMLVLLLTHPNDVRTLIQFYLYHEPARDITLASEHATSGWNRPSMKRVWELLDMTSRSFAAVIKELDGDLARVICLFYVVLRGLDTVEDDMTIPDDVKQPMLRSFHEKTVTPGWSYAESKEKDRMVLVDYPSVIEEILRLEPNCREVIVDICHKMENGMADYAHHAATSGEISLATIEDYDLYCHYVAGLVGEGLSRLFSATGKEAPWLADQLELSNSMGILLQKTNIIRDFREDADDKRYFWPREIWASPVYGRGVPATDIRQLYAPEEAERAAWVQSAMVLDALRHATDALDYLRLLHNQSVFKLAAIPAAMALATLDLCFMNPVMFQRNIKIRKAQAARLIMRSTNTRDVAYMFRDYARSIHAKASPADPSFLKLSVALAKIEMWAEHHYPSFVQVSQSKLSGAAAPIFDSSDPRSLIAKADAEHDQTAATEKRRAETRARLDELRAKGQTPPEPVKPEGIPWDIFGIIALIVVAICSLGYGIVATIIYFSD
ncbi:farnesyl-diphosphate farnesyltransferase [Amylostereum chailletii]|nr:farnesyl-diphosphate farnesyltransferase [Amylostereum chailletii]